MFNRTQKNDANDLSQDVVELADSLESLLKSYGSKTKAEADDARDRASALLKETRAKLQHGNRVTQAARDAGEQVNSYVRDNPWYGVGVGTAIGLLAGALIGTSGVLKR